MVNRGEKEEKIERILIENFVSLQKVMTHLSHKFEGLTNQISKLLEIFEMSAKSIAEKEYNSGKKEEEIKELMDKMDKIIEQNKILARGLTLLHEKSSEENSNLMKTQEFQKSGYVSKSQLNKSSPFQKSAQVPDFRLSNNPNKEKSLDNSSFEYQKSSPFQGQ